MKFLILEDNKEFSDALSMLLTAHGHTYELTCVVEEAIELFRSRFFDAVISDIHLNTEKSRYASGIDLVKFIRFDYKSNTPIAMTTGLDLIQRKEIQDWGVDIFHYKPLEIGFENFLKEIYDCIQKRKVS